MPTRITDLVLRSFKALATSGIYMLNLVLSRLTTASETSSSCTVAPKAVYTLLLSSFSPPRRPCLFHSPFGYCSVTITGISRILLALIYKVHISIMHKVYWLVPYYHFACYRNDRGILPNDTLETLLNVTNKESGWLRSNFCNLWNSGHGVKREREREIAASVGNVQTYFISDGCSFLRDIGPCMHIHPQTTMKYQKKCFSIMQSKTMFYFNNPNDTCIMVQEYICYRMFSTGAG